MNELEDLPATIICPVCGNMTIDGDWDICYVCFWEYDPVQNDDPTLAGGANHTSLIEARENYKKFGATEERFIKFVRPYEGQNNDETH